MNNLTQVRGPSRFKYELEMMKQHRNLNDLIAPPLLTLVKKDMSSRDHTRLKSLGLPVIKAQQVEKLP